MVGRPPQLFVGLMHARSADGPRDSTSHDATFCLRVPVGHVRWSRDAAPDVSFVRSDVCATEP